MAHGSGDVTASVYAWDDGERKRGPRIVPAKPILFVDGHCLLCQRAAQWVVDHDRYGRVALAALQGEIAQRLLPPELRGGAGRAEAPGSLVWRGADGRLAVRSEAVIAVAVAIGGWYATLAGVLRLVPRPVRDALYRLVAGQRHRLGAAAGCPLPDRGRRQAHDLRP